MAQYDLTPKLTTFLDPHLSLPLLQFHSSVTKLFPSDQLSKSQFQILQKTRCSDSKIELANKILEGNQRSEFIQKCEEEKKDILSNLEKLRENNLIQIILDQNLVEELNKEEHFNFSYLSQNHQITEDDLLHLTKVAKLEFEIGNYADAQKFLAVFRTLGSDIPKEKLEKLDKEKMMSVGWGKLASDILVAGSSRKADDWTSTLYSFNYLRSQLDSKSFVSPLKLLIQRTWLSHWGLFLYFAHNDSPLLMLEHFFENYQGSTKQLHSGEHFLHAIQINAPYYLRYLAAAIILSRRRSKSYSAWLKELTKIVAFEEHSYKDPITEFLTLLYVNFNFEGALDKLKECQEVLANDFFLKNFQTEFIENAKLSTFDVYCKIHSRIDINYLKEKLGFEQKQAEKWIINLIHQAKMDATIDSDKNQIIMKPQQPSLYQQILGNAKDTSNRTNHLTLALSKLAEEEK